MEMKPLSSKLRRQIEGCYDRCCCCYRRNLGFGDYYSQVSNLQHYFVDEFPWMMMMTNDDAMLFALKRFQTDELDGAGDGTCHHSERIGFPFSLSRSGDKQRRNKENFEGGVVANMVRRGQLK
ncbi:hypothetical protein AAHE18_01G125500 [Arachis hypogaea]